MTIHEWFLHVIWHDDLSSSYHLTINGHIHWRLVSCILRSASCSSSPTGSSWLLSVRYNAYTHGRQNLSHLLCGRICTVFFNLEPEDLIIPEAFSCCSSWLTAAEQPRIIIRPWSLLVRCLARGRHPRCSGTLHYPSMVQYSINSTLYDEQSWQAVLTELNWATALNYCTARTRHHDWIRIRLP